jgi:K+-transporting ATPase ATPase C chain
MFPQRAHGSLIDEAGATASNGGAIGSRLVAQAFVDSDGQAMEEYFQPRPSAVSYDAAASGASNWGASNSALRRRVIGLLGPILKYSDGRPVGPDIAHWVRMQLERDRAVLTQWVNDDADLPERWASMRSIAAFLDQWAKEHPADIANWHREHSSSDKLKRADLAKLFFASYAQGETTNWPATAGHDLQTAFFPVWWQAHRQALFEAVPADMVMASGSGLDPHITLKNALYQLDRVAGKWAAKLNVSSDRIAGEVRALVEEKKEAPLGGLVGVELINVLELNAALAARMQVAPQ